MISLPLCFWGLLGLVLLGSCHAVDGRELESNATSIYIPGLFDFDWGEEVRESCCELNTVT